MHATRLDRMRVAHWLAVPVAIASTAVLVAAPWLRQELVAAGWLGVAGGLMLVTGRRGWRVELAVLTASVLAIALAFHWTPEVLADAMRASRLVGFGFAVPIVLWDACRLAAGGLGGCCGRVCHAWRVSLEARLQPACLAADSSVG